MTAISKILAAVCGLMVVGSLDAADEVPDEEMIEFLGSWEGDEKDWQDFVDGWPLPPQLDTPDSEMNERSENRESD